MDRGVWQATVHGVAELDTTQGLNNNNHVGDTPSWGRVSYHLWTLLSDPPTSLITQLKWPQLPFLLNMSNETNCRLCNVHAVWPHLSRGTNLPAIDHMFDGSKGWLGLAQGKNQLLCLPVLQNNRIPFGEDLGAFIECHFSVDLKQAKAHRKKEPWIEALNSKEPAGN